MKTRRTVKKGSSSSSLPGVSHRWVRVVVGRIGVVVVSSVGGAPLRSSIASRRSTATADSAAVVAQIVVVVVPRPLRMLLPGAAHLVLRDPPRRQIVDPVLDGRSQRRRRLDPVAARRAEPFPEMNFDCQSPDNNDQCQRFCFKLFGWRLSLGQ